MGAPWYLRMVSMNIRFNMFKAQPSGGLLYVRDLSCRLRCSLLLKALWQNWHLYLRSGAIAAFRDAGAEDAGGGRTETFAPGIVTDASQRLCRGGRELGF